MKSLDATPFVRRVEQIVAAHALDAPGAYRRFAAAPPTPDPYGCADAANLLYTLDRLPGDAASRHGFVESLRELQDPETGLFREDTHHPIHTTAHCIAALELFDAAPRHPLAHLAPLRDVARLRGFLAGLAWREDPWHASHQGAGLYAALVLAGAVDAAWEDAYFAWLRAAWDPETGLLHRDAVPARAAWSASANPFPHLAGTFHYLFNVEHRREALPHAAALVESCLEIHARELFPLGRFVGFAEIDWIYCLHRAARRSGHRLAEARAALRALAEAYVPFLLALDSADAGFDDLHRVFGALCALTELQQALPGHIATERPLRLVLDRRPFI